MSDLTAEEIGVILAAYRLSAAADDHISFGKAMGELDDALAALDSNDVHRLLKAGYSLERMKVCKCDSCAGPGCGWR